VKKFRRGVEFCCGGTRNLLQGEPHEGSASCEKNIGVPTTHIKRGGLYGDKEGGEEGPGEKEGVFESESEGPGEEGGKKEIA
jgi:hypothetical protein